MRVDVNPSLLRWARERAGLDPRLLAARFPKLADWEESADRPTLKQLERYAKATYAPLGALLLQEPPVEPVPIPDFRTVANERLVHPGANLLDTIYTCQQRQDLYRDFARTQSESLLSFVGSARVGQDVVTVATRMREALGFDVAERRRDPTWTDALRRFIEQADGLGILVMVSGVVGNNNRRKLDPGEFRGFALSDDLAPLVFINGADTKAAQMFTLAHELAHIWIGQSALSDVGPVASSSNEVETWCNRVASELLVPLTTFQTEHRRGAPLTEEVPRLARVFKVSSLVVIRRLHDAGRLGRDEMWRVYEQEVDRLRSVPRRDGGDFYLTQAARVSKRFARALVSSTLEGQTLYRDAFRLLGFSKLTTFRELGHSVGVG